MWALIGPGLSDPGHIEIHSRTIYLDSDTLLGTRQEITAGRLERRAVLRCFGVALHETFHAKHTKRWAIEHDIKLAESDDPDERQLAIDRRLLEEPRMEAHGVREHPAGTLRGRFVRHALKAAVIDVILPAFAQRAPRRGDGRHGRSRATWPGAPPCICRRAPTTASSTRPPSTGCATCGGRSSATRISTRWMSCSRSSSGSRTASSRRLTAPHASTARSSERPTHPHPKTTTTRGAAITRTGGSGDEPAAGSLGEALEQALEQAREGQLEQLDADLDLQQVLADAAADPRARLTRVARGRGTGMPTGRMPDRGVDRPPAPDEIQHARRYATRLRQALTHGTRQIDKRTPGGRFDGRAYARGQAQRQTGRPVTTHPWRITRQVTAPIQEPHVGLVIDTSGSMGAYEYALGPICWILTDGLRQIGGRCATALFGNSAALLADGTRPLPLVPGIKTGGGTAFAGDAIELLCEQLEMTNPRRPRFVYVL